MIVDRAHFVGDLVCFLAEWEGWEDEGEDWMDALAAHLAVGLLQEGSDIASLCDEIERLRTVIADLQQAIPPRASDLR